MSELQTAAAKPGRMLESMGNTSDPAFFTHFDCWHCEESGEDWEWRDKDSDSTCLALILEAESLTGKDLDSIRVDLECDKYADVDSFLAAITPHLLAAGFDVYESDTVYEAYFPTDYAPCDNCESTEYESLDSGLCPYCAKS